MSTMNIENRKQIWRNKAGKLHREDGPAVEWVDGTKEWWFYGQCHRFDGPAIECANGDKVWWMYGKLHRFDGPAAEFSNGYNEWYIYHREVSKTEFTNLLVQHHLKIQLLRRVLPHGSESLIDQYTM